MPAVSTSQDSASIHEPSRSQKLQLLGILCGFTAGAWLGAAEAPTKLVSVGVSPLVISLIMVIGVFLARWSLPALILGTSSIHADVRRAPHLIIWAVLAGCIWAVANTLTIFAIRDIGLSIAFPLWNSNSLLGIFWVSFSSMSCARPAGAAGPVYWAARWSCVPERRYSLSHRPRKRLPRTPRAEFGPHSVPESFGARCTFLIAKPI